MNRLREILDTMDMPEMRKTDVRWLARNLFIKNNNHPDVNEAVEIIMNEIRKQ